MDTSTFRVTDFFDFMKEREAIRLRKESGDPWPWTEDATLRDYKFTNVKREHDRTTRILKEQLYELHQDAEPAVCLLNAATYRYFGTWEMGLAVGWQNDFDPRGLLELASSRKAAGKRVFTGAYVITNGGIKAPKEQVVVERYLTALWKNAPQLAEIRSTESWEKLIRELQKVEGFGGTGFMAKETVLDLAFTPFWPNRAPADRNTWSPSGPGARRGAACVLGRPPVKGLSESSTMAVMRKLFEMRADYWPENYVELEMHDIQFQLCEFAKYEKVRLGLGRPRSKYSKPKA